MEFVMACTARACGRGQHSHFFTLISTVNEQLARLLNLQCLYIYSHSQWCCAWPQALAVRDMADPTRHGRLTLRNHKPVHPRVVPLSWRANDPECALWEDTPAADILSLGGTS